MSARTKHLKRDAGQLPTSQYYNPATDEFEDNHGSNGAMHVQLTGSLAVENVKVIPMHSNILIATGTTYNLPSVDIGNIVELRGAARLASPGKFSVATRYSETNPYTSANAPSATLVDNTSGTEYNVSFSDVKPCVGGYYNIQITNKDTKDLTLVVYTERRIRKYA